VPGWACFTFDLYYTYYAPEKTGRRLRLAKSKEAAQTSTGIPEELGFGKRNWGFFLSDPNKTSGKYAE
jgi:hypothetical protein